jgi:hypothetical protein
MKPHIFITALVALAITVALPSFAAADPGSPGVNSAGTGVYNGGEPLGEPPETGNTPLGEPPTGGQQNAAERGSIPFTVPTSDEKKGSNVSSLPFTGLSAAIVIGAALLLLVAGVTARRVAGRES